MIDYFVWILGFVDVETPTLFKRTPGVGDIHLNYRHKATVAWFLWLLCEYFVHKFSTILWSSVFCFLSFFPLSVMSLCLCFTVLFRVQRSFWSLQENLADSTVCLRALNNSNNSLWWLALIGNKIKKTTKNHLFFVSFCTVYFCLDNHSFWLGSFISLSHVTHEYNWQMF